MRYLNPKSHVSGRILGISTMPIIEKPKDISHGNLEKPVSVKNLKPMTGKGIGDNEFRDKLKRLSLANVPQKEKLKNISFDL